MSAGIKRVFVGWERPMLHALTDFLRQRAREGKGGRLGAAEDLSGLSVVLPGARAGRRLLELLALSAPGGVVIPPRILTLGAWAGLGMHGHGVPAGTMARLAAWTTALRDMDPELRHAVARVAETEDNDDGTNWLGVARLVDSCHTELCGEGLRFEDVMRRGPMAQDFADIERWMALAQAQRRYEEVLRRADFVDAGLASLEGVESGRVDRGALTGAGGGGGGTVVLAGISEMNAMARRMVDAVTEHCVALVPAPPEMAERFDEYGCVIPAAWEGARIDIPDEAVIAGEGPGEQAAAALRLVERLTHGAGGAGMPADQITIGVPDAEVEERLRRLSGRLGNAPVRRAEGTPVAFTRPVKLLLGIADYLERHDFDALAALVRHPDVERWIAGSTQMSPDGVSPERWLALLDEYQSEHLHGRLDGTWLTDKPRERETLQHLHHAVTGLLGGEGTNSSLLGKRRREPACWCAPVWDIISAVYSGVPQLEPATREACFVIQTHLAELAALPAELGAGWRLTPAEAVRLVVQQAAGDAIPEPGESTAIDLVGWLELAADDAPVAIVTGMNEGKVPSAAGMDPLLPEGLRRALGLRDRRARLARDAFAMLVIAGSRPAGRAAFIFGRRSAAGDPLAPSRLLLMGDDRSLLPRIRLWTGAERSALDAGTLMIRHGATSLFETGPRLLGEPGEIPAIEEMSVTSFRQYLESPYGFYLRHVLRLEETDDRAVELDALGFGTLIHDVLLKLVDADVAACDDPERLAAFLFSHLEGIAKLRFGPDPRAEVWVQLEQARARLRAFAHVQAAWAKQGWRVARTEWSPGRRTAFLEVDGKPMYLRGRIDRIDVNPSLNAWAVLDYKTSSTKPDVYDACTRQGEWRDPQLALYRHLARGLAKELGVSGEPRLAWIALPTAAAESEVVEAEWTDVQLLAADEAMAEVIRHVRRGEFSELGRSPPGEGIVGWLCGGLEAEEGEE